MLRSPISWVGGKFKLREKIIGKFPAHQTYVELFSGAAWVLFGKDPATSRAEVLNDRDSELVNFWRIIKHRPAEFAERASKLLASRELFNDWKQLFGHPDEIERAVRFFFVIRMAYGAKRNEPAWGTRREKRPAFWWPDAHADIEKARKRLSVVWIEHETWERCIKLYDAAETFFYADPPYRCDGAKAYAHRFTDDNHAELAEGLRKSRGKWLVSYNDDAFLRKLYRGRGITI